MIKGFDSPYSEELGERRNGSTTLFWSEHVGLIFLFSPEGGEVRPGEPVK